MTSRKALDPFQVRGSITVQDSANVVCVRRRPGVVQERLRLDDCFPGMSSEGRAKQHGAWSSLFGDGGMEFTCGWEVLLGQAEVINWLKAAPDKLTSVRYAGEFKPAGGAVDAGETIEGAARRELHEEFLRPLGLGLPESAQLRAFSVKQTRPIRSRSNVIYNFVALAEENPWLRDFDVDAVNRALADRRREFKALVESGRYWQLSPTEKELVAPEIHQIAWVPLREAIRYCMQSMVPGYFVNDYQRNEFARYKKKDRDPMFITAAALVELETFPTSESLVEYSRTVSLDDMRENEQWLFAGMTAVDVDRALASRVGGATGVNPSFKSSGVIAQLREARLNHSSKL